VGVRVRARATLDVFKVRGRDIYAYIEEQLLSVGVRLALGRQAPSLRLS